MISRMKNRYRTCLKFLLLAFLLLVSLIVVALLIENKNLALYSGVTRKKTDDITPPLRYADDKLAHVIPPAPNASDITHTSRIPKIIHQFWDDEIIPTEYVEYARSLVRDNPPPEWQYYFWTMKTARTFIRDKYPTFLPTFDKYPDDLSRADASRYVILYEYGGVYFDMDTVSVKSLDPFLRQHICSFVNEPDEHLLVYGSEYLLTNSAMLCRPRHPFFKYIMDNLPSLLKKKCKNAYGCTGPGVLTQFYMNYKLKPNDFIDVVPTDLFQDMYFVRMRSSQIREKCSKIKSQNKVKNDICASWNARGRDARNISVNAFTYHTYNYSHRDGKWKSITFKPENNISRIVPHLRMYTTPRS